MTKFVSVSSCCSAKATAIKDHAHKNGIRLIGDLPFFVSPDSSDVWAHPELFLLDENRRPRVVAGVPPDYFSAQGQLWGNPIYNWNALRQAGYRWCICRLRALLAHVDVVRLDHFRAFAAAWHVPAGEPTAQSGKWIAGPGADFFRVAQRELGVLPLIAEDLGFITPDVYALRDQYHLPGMRVLQFAFDGNPDNPYLPPKLRRRQALWCTLWRRTTILPEPRAESFLRSCRIMSCRESVEFLEVAQDNESSEAVLALMGLAGSSGAALSMETSRLPDFAEPGERSPDERSGPSRRQLEMALFGKHAVRPGLRMAARSDEKLEQELGSSG